MKKTVALCLTAVLLFTLSACNKTEIVKLNTVQLIKAENKEENVPSETPDKNGNEENTEIPSESGNKETPSENEKTPENGETASPAVPSGDASEKPATGGNKTPSASNKPSGSDNPSSSESSCPHRYQSTKNFKYPTATETGYSGDSVCNDCGKAISSGETIAKTKVVSHDCPDMEKQIFDGINAERKKAGVGELVWDENLYAGAKIRAKEYYEYADHGIGGPHQRPDGRIFFTAVEENSGYKDAYFEHHGENCAADTGGGMNFVEGWMQSTKGHRENLLRQSFIRAAIAVYYENNTYFAVNIFVG